VTPLKIQAANLTLTYYKTLRLYSIPSTTPYIMACAVLHDSASDPYRPESNGDKRITTYFSRDAVKTMVVLMQLKMFMMV
jgi:hypothetical protein